MSQTLGWKKTSLEEQNSSAKINSHPMKQTRIGCFYYTLYQNFKKVPADRKLQVKSHIMSTIAQVQQVYQQLPQYQHSTLPVYQSTPSPYHAQQPTWRSVFSEQSHTERKCSCAVYFYTSIVTVAYLFGSQQRKCWLYSFWAVSLTWISIVIT